MKSGYRTLLKKVCYISLCIEDLELETFSHLVILNPLLKEASSITSCCSRWPWVARDQGMMIVTDRDEVGVCSTCELLCLDLEAWALEPRSSESHLRDVLGGVVSSGGHVKF